MYIYKYVYIYMYIYIYVNILINVTKNDLENNLYIGLYAHKQKNCICIFYMNLCIYIYIIYIESTIKLPTVLLEKISTKLRPKNLPSPQCQEKHVVFKMCH